MTIHTPQLLDQVRRRAVPPRADPNCDAARLRRVARHHDESAFAARLARHGPLVVALGLAIMVLGVGALPSWTDEAPAIEAKPKGASVQASRPPAAEHGAGRLDLYGDPLPADALVRFGTLRHRYPGDPYEKLAPDGKSLLVAGGRGIRLVDLDTGRLLASWVLPQSWSVCGLAPDGRSALVDDSTRFRLWDIHAQKTSLTFEYRDQPALQGARSLMISAAFALDGKLVATTVRGDRLRVWEVATGRELWHVSASQMSILGFPADGKTLALRGIKSGRISIHDRVTGQELRSFAAVPREEFVGVTMSLDHKAILFGSSGTAVRIWDLATGEERPPLDGHAKKAYHVVAGRDGKTILTGGGGSVIHVWEWPASKLRRQIDLGAKQVPWKMNVSPDGKRLEVVPFSERALHVFDLDTAKELPQSDTADRRGVSDLAICADGTVLSTAYDDVRIWDLRTARQSQQFKLGHRAWAWKLSLRADERVIASIDVNSAEVRLHERQTGRLVRTINTGGENLHAVAFAPRGNLLATGAMNWRRDPAGAATALTLWDSDTGKEVLRGTHFPWTMCFSPDGQHLAYVDADRVKVWLLDLATGRERQLLSLKRGNAVAFSPDGQTLACDDDKAIILWEVASRQERGRIDVATESIFAGLPIDTLAFSPDGRWIAVGEERLVQLCDVLRGETVHTFQGHIGQVARLVFGADGRTLVSASYDTTLLAWDVGAVVSRLPVPRALADAAALAGAWNNLADSDAKAAYRAMRVLVESPKQAVSFLQARLKPAAIRANEQQVQLWIAQAGDEQFKVRQAAIKALEGLGGHAEPALRQAVQGDIPLETRRRLEELLKRLDEPPPLQAMRTIRAVQVLERIGNPEARAALAVVAAGAPAAPETRAARSALERLARRAVQAP